MQSAAHAHRMLLTEVLDRAFADEQVQRPLQNDWLQGFPKDDVAPGNRRCTVCCEGPRWCCACPCSGCGLANDQCKCEVGQYELHPFMASWESQWHTVGHRQDFKRGVCVLTTTVRELFDEELKPEFVQKAVMKKINSCQKAVEAFFCRSRGVLTEAEKSSSEKPKMLCKESCEMNFPQICTKYCRYSCGHSDDVAHMCEQCFQWWQFLPGKEGMDGSEAWQEIQQKMKVLMEDKAKKSSSGATLSGSSPHSHRSRGFNR